MAGLLWVPMELSTSAEYLRYSLRLILLAMKGWRFTAGGAIESTPAVGRRWDHLLWRIRRKTLCVENVHFNVPSGERAYEFKLQRYWVANSKSGWHVISRRWERKLVRLRSRSRARAEFLANGTPR